ncbi:MAG: ATP-binding protein [Planctomycetota bacterium]|jgi:serine/threonine-protein kinase RsbW|nr:ATP-binding protein [Planctomycetota bacterium]
MMEHAVHAGEPPQDGELLLKLEAPSTPRGKDLLIDSVERCLCERDWISSEDASWLRMCLEEAVLNAVLHGNQGDPTLPVRVEMRVHAGRWMLLISDHGTGFAADEVPSMEGMDALLREHGRGIFLMGEWLDELCYYRGGSTVLLARRCVVDDTDQTGV